MDEFERSTLIVRQTSQCAVDLFVERHAFCDVGLDLRIGHAVVEAVDGAIVLAAGQKSATAVGRDCHQPRFEGTPRINARHRQRGTAERFLRDVFGIVMVAEIPQANVVNHLPVAFEDFSERRFVLMPATVDQSGVGKDRERLRVRAHRMNSRGRESREISVR